MLTNIKTNNNLFIKSFFIIVFINFPLNLIHLLGINIGINISKIILPIIIFVFVLWFLVLLSYNKRILKIDILFLTIFVLYLILSSFLGLIRGFSVERILTDVVSLISPIFLFVIVKNLKFDNNLIKQKILNYSSIYVYVFLVYAGVLFYLNKFIDIQFNLTFGTTILVLASMLLLMQEKYKLFFLSMFLIVISAKRSIIIFFLFSMVLYLKDNSFVKKHRSFFCFILILTIITFGVLFNDIINILTLINPKLIKFEYLNIFSDSFDIYKFSSGRITEVINAYEQSRLYDLVNYIGTGSGFTYKFNLTQFNFNQIKNNLHISFFSLLFKYGILFILLFYGYLFLNLIIVFQKNIIKNKFYYVLFVYIIVFIGFYSNTSYAFVVSYEFWLLFGFLSNRNISNIL